jgi:phosphatidylinositol-3-phosphatase
MNAAFKGGCMQRILSALLACALCGTGVRAADLPAAVRHLPRPDHVVVVFEENRAYTHIIGNMAAPYINTLANRGALFSRSFGVTHPSLPNYLAFFSGSTQNVADDECRYRFTGPNLASSLFAAGLTFATYSEDLPEPGYAGCRHLNYERKHNPAVNWQGVNVPASANLPLTRFPADFARLPTVSFVVPNQENDMHNGAEPDTIVRGDRWLRAKLDAYVRWADTHNSLLIVTWDEDDDSAGNHIATIFVGPMVRQGLYARRIDHYTVLRALLDLYGLPPLGKSAAAASLDYVWTANPAKSK